MCWAVAPCVKGTFHGSGSEVGEGGEVSCRQPVGCAAMGSHMCKYSAQRHAASRCGFQEAGFRSGGHGARCCCVCGLQKRHYRSDLAKFNEQLATGGLCIRDIRGDGNCMVRMFAWAGWVA